MRSWSLKIFWLFPVVGADGGGRGTPVPLFVGTFVPEKPGVGLMGCLELGGGTWLEPEVFV